MRIRAVAALACVLLAAAPAVADTVYSNGAAENRNGGQAESDISQWWADDFILLSPAQVTGIRFWGGYFNPPDIPTDDDFTLVIYGDDSSLPDPGSVVATIELGKSWRASTGGAFSILGSTSSVYVYEDTFAPLALAAGTTYWAAVYNSTPGVDGVWIWATSAHPGSSAHTVDSGSTWTAYTGDEFAFELTAGAVTVPLPPTFVLCGTGMLAAALARRLRRMRS